MVKGLQADMKQMQREQAGRQTPRSRGEPTDTPHQNLLGMWSQGTCAEAVPPGEEGVFKHQRLTVTFAYRGPQANPIRGEMTQGVSSRPVDTTKQAHRRRRKPKSLPDPPAQPPTTRMELQETGWQAPWRSRRPQGLPDPKA